MCQFHLPAAPSAQAYLEHDGIARRGLTSSRADLTDANGAWNFTTGKLSNAIHSFKAKAVDIAGNVGASPGVALYGTTANDTILDEA